MPYVRGSRARSSRSRTPGSTTPTTTLTGLDQPRALTFDASGDLFVANYNGGHGNTVTEFTATSLTPTAGGVVILPAQSSEPMSIGGDDAPANQVLSMLQGASLAHATIAGTAQR